MAGAAGKGRSRLRTNAVHEFGRGDEH